MESKDGPTGFYWRTDDTFNVVILHPGRKVKKGKGKGAFCEEFVAASPEALIRLCEGGDGETGYYIGSPDEVRRLCEEAPRWRFLQRYQR